MAGSPVHPLLSPLDEQEQRRLVAVASQILQNKRIVPLQGLELTSLMQARIALLFALPVMELGQNAWTVLTRSCSTQPLRGGR